MQLQQTGLLCGGAGGIRLIGYQVEEEEIFANSTKPLS